MKHFFKAFIVIVMILCVCKTAQIILQMLSPIFGKKYIAHREFQPE